MRDVTGKHWNDGATVGCGSWGRRAAFIAASRVPHRSRRCGRRRVQSVHRLSFQLPIGHRRLHRGVSSAVDSVGCAVYNAATRSVLWRYTRSLWSLYGNDIHVTGLRVTTCGRRASGPDLAPFSYISPQKPSFNDKVWTYYRILVSKTGKKSGTTSPAQFSLICSSNSFGGVTYAPPLSPAAHFKETCISLQDRPAANVYTVI